MLQRAGGLFLARYRVYGIPRTTGFEPSSLEDGSGDGAVEHARVARPHVHHAAGSEPQPVGLAPRHLSPEALAVAQQELDPDLEAEVHDTLDVGPRGRAVRLEANLDVVRADEAVAEPVDR